jgi:hypothetical protein
VTVVHVEGEEQTVSSNSHNNQTSSITKSRTILPQQPIPPQPSAKTNNLIKPKSKSEQSKEQPATSMETKGPAGEELGRGKQVKKPSSLLKAIQQGEGSTGSNRTTRNVTTPSAKAAIMKIITEWLVEDNEADEVKPTAMAAMMGNKPSLKEALAGPERDRWIKACKAELAALEKKGTFELVR